MTLCRDTVIKRYKEGRERGRESEEGRKETEKKKKMGEGVAGVLDLF